MTNLTNEIGLFAKNDVLKSKLEKKVDNSRFENLLISTKKKDEK
jgi:hypothetical protein